MILFIFSQCERCLVPGPLSVLLKIAILLCLPAMCVAMVVVARAMKPGKARDRAVMAMPILALVLLFFTPLFLTADWPRRYSPLVLHQGSFEWPARCAPRKYREGDEISIACRDDRNALPHKLVLDHGFPGTIGRGDRDYYRVGSDAVRFSCNFYTERCAVSHVEPNVFR